LFLIKEFPDGSALGLKRKVRKPKVFIKKNIEISVTHLNQYLN